MKTADIRNSDYKIVARDVQLVSDPLWFHTKGLMQTATGYGSKLTTEYKVPFNGKLYRVYATCFSNCATLWFTAKGERFTVS